MTMREVRCEACGIVNRVSAYSIRRVPKCGRCRSKLPEPRSTVAIRAISNLRMQIVALPMLSLLGLAIWYGTVSPAGKQTSASTSSAATKQFAPRSKCVSYALPPHGLYEENDTSERPARLTIVSPRGLLYLVNLEMVESGSPTLLFFLHGGRPLNVGVPLGEFRLKVAAGSDWCGDANLFGDGTVFSEADNTLRFERSITDNGNSTLHLTIELPTSNGGQLITRRISRSEFFGR